MDDKLSKYHKSGWKAHCLSDVATENVGEGTEIWQYAVVLGNVQIGRNCNINAHCFIEDDVIIGDNVTIKCGVYLWNGVRIEDDVFVGPNVTFINDKYPRSKIYPESFVKTVIKKGASIGAASTIMCGISIGERALIGAHSLVLCDIPANQVWYGVPAKYVRDVLD